MATLCHVFGVHRSSYKYWKNRPEKPDGRRAVLRSQVLELHGISHGSAGARSIATMATQRGYQMGRWLAGRLMKELGLVSCQQPTHRYKRGGHEHVARGQFGYRKLLYVKLIFYHFWFFWKRNILDVKTVMRGH